MTVRTNASINVPFTVVNVHYLSTMQTTSLEASVAQTTLPSPITELINQVNAGEWLIDAPGQDHLLGQ